MKATYFGDTNVGNVRSRNEDTFLLKEVWDGTHLLAVVIDGVGGHGGGDVAANLAAKCISEHFCECPTATNSLEVLEAAVVYANNTIISQQISPWLSNMSCALTAALINLSTGQLHVCHIGDTRLYCHKDGILTKITSDHSIVGPMEESGLLTEEQAMKHPRRNIITKVVGRQLLQMGSEYMQTLTMQLTPCTLLLCSDGLYDMVTSSQTAAILGENASEDTRVAKLIDAALAAGGKDNITILTITLTQS